MNPRRFALTLVELRLKAPASTEARRTSCNEKKEEKNTTPYLNPMFLGTKTPATPSIELTKMHPNNNQPHETTSNDEPTTSYNDQNIDIENKSTAPMPNAQSQESKESFNHLHASLFNVALFTCLCLLSMAFFVLFDIYLTTEKSIGGATQSKWENRWWSLPPLQLIFYVGVLFGCCKFILQLSKPKDPDQGQRQRPCQQKRFNVIFLVLLVLSGILVLSIPEITRRQLGATAKKVQRGNCTYSHLELVQKGGAGLCPYYSVNPHYFQLNPTSTLGGNVGMEKNIMDAYLILKGIFEYMPLIRTFDLPGFEQTKEHLFSSKCEDEMLNFVCNLISTPCKYEDCSQPSKGLKASCQLKWFDDVIQCGVNQCLEVAGCDATADFSPKKVERFLNEMNNRLGIHLTGVLKDAFDEYQKNMMKAVWHALWTSAVQVLKGTTHSSVCDSKWWDNDPEQLNNNIMNSNETSCNPEITTFRWSGAEQYYDGSIVLICAIVVACILLLLYGHNPTFPRPGYVRIVSVLLGLSLTAFTFVGGVNVERASISSVDQSINIELQFWASLYYIVSGMCFQHSILMVFPETPTELAVAGVVAATKPKEESPMTRRKNAVRNSHLIQSAIGFKNFVVKDVFSSRGKYYFLRFYAKEALEVGFQLAGIINSESETEATSASSTAIFVGLNLIMVPLTYSTAMYYSGPTLATGLTVLVESLFDKIFVVLSVMVRSTETTIGGTTVAEKILRHGLTLVPAISFAVNKSSYINLAEQYQAHNQAEAKKKSKQAVTKNWGTLKLSSVGKHTIAKTIKLHALKKSKADTNIVKSSSSFPSSRNLPRRRRSSLVVYQKKNKFVDYFTKAANTISMLCGVLLVIVVSIRSVQVRTKCHKLLGPIADCAFPKYYFRNGLLTGELTCAEDQYSTIDCTQNPLPQNIKYIKENPTMYANMMNVTTITITNHRFLLAIPESFASIPTLTSLNVSGNTNLMTLPYSLCSLSLLRNKEVTIEIKNTKIETELVWNGDILKHAKTINRTHPVPVMAVQPGCLNALKDTLTHLSLANNELTCVRDYILRPDMENQADHTWSGFNNLDQILENVDDRGCQFSQVVQLRQLSYLDLRNNNITDLRMSLVEPTLHILDANETGGISFESNAIDNIAFGTVAKITVNKWMAMSKTITSPSNIKVVQIRIGNIDDAAFAMYNLKRFSAVTHVDLFGNKLEKLEVIMNHLPPNLLYLKLSGNYIEKLEGKPFIHFNKLETLILRGQLKTSESLYHIEPGVFEGLANLTDLDLRSVDLSEPFSKNTWAGLNQLTSLTFYGAELQFNITKNSFESLPTLKVLNLGKMRGVYNYNLGCFNGLRQVTRLVVELGRNQQGIFQPELFEPLLQLKELDIRRSIVSAPRINATNIDEIGTYLFNNIRNGSNVTVRGCDLNSSVDALIFLDGEENNPPCAWEYTCTTCTLDN